MQVAVLARLCISQFRVNCDPATSPMNLLEYGPKQTRIWQDEETQSPDSDQERTACLISAPGSSSLHAMSICHSIEGCPIQRGSLSGVVPHLDTQSHVSTRVSLIFAFANRCPACMARFMQSNGCRERVSSAQARSANLCRGSTHWHK